MGMAREEEEEDKEKSLITLLNWRLFTFAEEKKAIKVQLGLGNRRRTGTNICSIQWGFRWKFYETFVSCRPCFCPPPPLREQLSSSLCAGQHQRRRIMLEPNWVRSNSLSDIPEKFFCLLGLSVASKLLLTPTLHPRALVLNVKKLFESVNFYESLSSGIIVMYTNENFSNYSFWCVSPSLCPCLPSPSSSSLFPSRYDVVVFSRAMYFSRLSVAFWWHSELYVSFLHLLSQCDFQRSENI